MNREIKFRIWCNNKFYYKCLVGNTNDVEDDKWTCPMIWLEDKKQWVNCDNGIISQYTGLKDENDKELYEGDVIDIKYKNITVKNAIITYKKASFYGLDDDNYWKLDCCSIKKIGNIYESEVEDVKDN